MSQSSKNNCAEAKLLDDLLELPRLKIEFMNSAAAVIKNTPFSIHVLTHFCLYNSDIQGVWKRALLIPLIFQDSKVKLAKKNKEGKKKSKYPPRFLSCFYCSLRLLKNPSKLLFFKAQLAKLGKNAISDFDIFTGFFIRLRLLNVGVASIQKNRSLIEKWLWPLQMAV